jgi:hypothetical protein
VDAGCKLVLEDTLFQDNEVGYEVHHEFVGVRASAVEFVDVKNEETLEEMLARQEQERVTAMRLVAEEKSDVHGDEKDVLNGCKLLRL